MRYESLQKRKARFSCIFLADQHGAAKTSPKQTRGQQQLFFYLHVSTAIKKKGKSFIFYKNNYLEDEMSTGGSKRARRGNITERL